MAERSVELTSVRSQRVRLQPINMRHEVITLSIDDLRRQPFRFGRNIECERSFPQDYRISGVHATLVWDAAATQLLIEDSSVNGTFVNGERVARGTRRALADQDLFFLVIPDPGMLQQGYTGSLITNLVGYRIRYEKAEPADGSHPGTAPPWAPRGAMPVANPNEVPLSPPPPPPPPPSAEVEERLSENPLRQTTNAPSWIHRLAKGMPADSTDEHDLAPPAAPHDEPTDGPTNGSPNGPTDATDVAELPETRRAPSHVLADTSGRASVSAAPFDHDHEEHVSFAAWWLGQRFGELGDWSARDLHDPPDSGWRGWTHEGCVDGARLVVVGPRADSGSSSSLVRDSST